MHRYFNDILKQVDENYVEKKVSVSYRRRLNTYKGGEIYAQIF